MDNDRYAPLHGLVAVTAFAATLPLTRLGLAGFAPVPLTFGRLLGATFAALAVLAFTRAPLPRPRQLAPLATVAAGGVIGFPLLTALALEGRAAAPGAIPLALMPLATAAWSRLRGHERPAHAFWLWAAAGAGLVVHFLLRGGGADVAPELYGAAVMAAVAYAEGGRLAREMPGWQVMAWALILSSPLAALGFGYSWAGIELPAAPAPWAALTFLAIVTQFGAFWFWYRALASGVARGSQVQLLQPFLTLLLAGVLLGESVPAELWFYGAAVAATVYLARTANSRATNPPMREARR